MSEDPTVYGDPETFRTPVTLTIHVSGRERRLLAALLGITPPAPGDAVQSWVARLVHAALAEVA